jgi:hypothetical protein
MSKPNPTIWTEGDLPEPVSPDHPLVGLERRVLQTWLDNSPSLAKAYQMSPQHRSDLENAVRLRVDAAFTKELQLRAAPSNLTVEQAQEQTRPAMWTPPIWPTTPPSPPRTPAANPLADSPSTTPLN